MFNQILEARNRLRDWFLGKQHPEGYWVAELQGDTILETEYAIYLHYMGWGDEDTYRKLANYVKTQQNEEGGWGIYPGAPTDISATVKSYILFRLAGHEANEPFMRRIRDVILKHGGIVKVNSFTKLYLALVGEFPWKGCPAIPPELILFPKNFYFSIYQMSSWSRTMIIPLAIVENFKVTRPFPFTVDELYVGGRENANVYLSWSRKFWTWHNFFLAWTYIIKAWQYQPLHPMRMLALRKCRQWLLERLEHTDGLATIFPAMVNSIFALTALGYSPDDPLVKREKKELERFLIHEGDTIRLQPCFSPVWDTGWVAVALKQSGLPSDHPALVNSAEWMLSKEATIVGDWMHKNPQKEPAGWYFEFRNEWYPDVDDTAIVLRALNMIEVPNQAELARAVERGTHWMIGMQCHNGGWASFDKDNDHELYTQVPFADHNAMIDPPTADITGRVLECLGELDYDVEHPVVRKAISFIKKDQCADGSWFGRWGSNYVYGTWQVLVGLAQVGEDLNQPYVQNAVRWLKSVQNEDGGWGESLATYKDPNLKGKGPSTASQTAWALLGLIAVGEARSRAARRGMEWLLSRQNPDGSFTENEWTGTGFPKVFYLRYHYYCNYFPLLACNAYLTTLPESRTTAAGGAKKEETADCEK
ncbi:MAG: squalene--hopene cyclase [Verrucomicrobiae bacterium]|nr:squalene--hopene cyclase [Verrucomicrobiae bacterium]